LVDNAIASGSLFDGATWKQLVENAIANKQPMHFIGLLSDGNVHSHIDHLEALLKRCDRDGVRLARVHVLLDGRDVPETSCPTFIDRLERLLAEISQSSDRDYRIASGGGRMTTTMDRYGADWSVVQRGYHAHVHGTGPTFKTTLAAVESMRADAPGIGDQNLSHFVIVDADGKPVGPIRDGASVVFFNFRGDRAIEISNAFEHDAFDKFDRGARPNVMFAGMMEYDGDLHVPARYLVSPPLIAETLGEYLARNQVTQLAISETQKFGHVTYFWNGNRSGKFDDKLETYIEVRSDNVPMPISA
jgi:2,3-bisphosphoglycerate-independent phosphoglycerate mutase